MQRSTAKVGKLLDLAVQLQQPAMALTDYGNLFGAIEFYTQAMRRGIKPILGCELNLCEDHQKRVSEGPRRPDFASIVLLARNNVGWQNLIKLVSIASLDGYYYEPRIDKTLLKKHSEGLIALSGGWSGEIESAFLKGNSSKAANLADEFKAIFEPECFFIELQRNNLRGQEELNQAMIRLAHEKDLPLVASNNIHFLHEDDKQAFKVLNALRNNRTLDDDDLNGLTDDRHVKSSEDMHILFEDVPEALDNAVAIAACCNVQIEFGNYQLPDFETPDGSDLNQFIRTLSEQGLEKRWPAILLGTPDADRQLYLERLNFELDIIIEMGFPGYFLIVSDFIIWGKQQGIPVGPGRGSGAGSLVAYVLEVTDLDPIKYGLLFERFLNPERISMPDFDIDFCRDRREEVITYVTQKYGEDKVAQIITYGAMKAKAVIRDVGRVLGIDLSKVNAIAKLIPADLGITLGKALEQEPRLGALMEEDMQVQTLFDLALRLEGMNRNVGKHAAGVIIGRWPLVETAPLHKDPREGGKVVQWDMGNSEKIGLIKFDFLGLKTLTVIDLACRLIRQTYAPDFDITAIPMQDEATFALMQRGQTAAVFQVESQGMRELLTKLKPDCFEDVIALVALYRPGPLESGMVETYIECKHGRQEIMYALPQLKPILQETNGVILYQEQVMKIAQVLAGYTLGQADMLRRAMGKKKPEEMQKQRKIFMEGAVKNNHEAAKAEQIFDLMEKFAGYGFNKSHSAAYGLICYQTAFLKAHYPQAFMAATLSCDMGSDEKVAGLVADCRSMGLDIIAPHINHSDWEFMPRDAKGILFGLGAIKGVGEAAIREIVKARKSGGEFASFEDLIMRIPKGVLNKRIADAMMKAGAFSGLVPHIHAGLEGLNAALDVVNQRRKQKNDRQSALFSAEDVADNEPALFPDISPWTQGECLQAEREVFGFFLTGHPLEEHLSHVRQLGDCHLGELDSKDNDATVIVPAFVSAFREYRTKRGATMAFVQIDDLYGSCELIVFAKTYEACREILQADKPILVAARVDASKDKPSLVAEHVVLLETVLPELVERIHLQTSSLVWDEKLIAGLTKFCCEQPLEAQGQSDSGQENEPIVPLHFALKLPDGSVAQLETISTRIQWNSTSKQWLSEHLDAASVLVHCKPWNIKFAEKRKAYQREQG
ncbi:MAG: DNA polymerase III subunit alpha [Zetaproteobacteria bacterium CG2_30_46_52]|nr:MAG: DNA polymerase III subunit alpha [Zetaproteobacteria bacterium CG2_30_46_52]